MLPRHPRPVCSAFQERRNYGTSTFCGWCGNHLVDHAFLDATVWSPAGPFVEAGRAELRVPNPAYRPVAAA
jgi:hypothetical protein